MDPISIFVISMAVLGVIGVIAMAYVGSDIELTYKLPADDYSAKSKKCR